MGGYTAKNTFRKTYQEGRKKSQYTSIVKTAEELANEDNKVESDSDDEEVEMEAVAMP
jgi:hypothetical protein